MAVTLTTRFFQNNEWRDIAKIVFTSPNMESPQVAGRRSHVLPGHGTLGLWYEDTSSMYRVLPDQEELPSQGSKMTYMGAFTVSSGVDFSFNTSGNAAFITLDYTDGVDFTTGSKLYYDKQNYGTVQSIGIQTKGVPSTPFPSITAYSGFNEPIRKGTQYRVYWESEGLYTTDKVNLLYSTNVGLSWVKAEQEIDNDGMHYFSIPEDTNQAIVKIESVDGYIYSMTPIFSVRGGEMSLLYPDIGNVLRTNVKQRVWWNNTLFYTDEPVGIDITNDGGDTWFTLASGIENLGYADITIPMEFTGQNLSLVVYSTDHPSEIYTVSSEFSTSFDSDIDLLWPAGGAVLTNGMVHKVWWNSAYFYTDDRVSVYLSEDDGANWTSVASGILNEGYAEINIPYTVETDSALIRIESTNDPDHINDENPVTFSIVGGSMDVLYPKNFNTLVNRVKQRIWWNSINYYRNSPITIDVSHDGGDSWVNVVSSVPNIGYADVYIPVASYSQDNCKIRIYNSDNPDGPKSYSDIFSIDVGEIEIKYPLSTGTNVGNETQHRIWWNCSDFYEEDTVSILVSTNSGVSYEALVSDAPNTGNCIVYIDNIASDNALFKVESSLFNDITYDVSNPVKIVDGSVDILYPNSDGLTLVSGEVFYVWWNSSNIYDDNRLYVHFSNDDGNTYKLLGHGFNDGMFNTVLDSPTVSGAGKIKITKTAVNGTVVGENEHSFNIAAPYIDIIAPTSSSLLRFSNNLPSQSLNDLCSVDSHQYNLESERHYAFWATNVPKGKSFSVYYSFNSGSSWSYAGNVTNCGAFPINDMFNVTTTVSGCRIKIEYTNELGDLITSISEPFTITTPIEKLTSGYGAVPIGYWTSTYSYNGYIYIISGKDNTVYRMKDGVYELVAAFTETAISRPYITVHSGDIYLINKDNFSVYKYIDSQKRWITLSPMWGAPICFEAASDSDPYIYCATDKVWYRYNTGPGSDGMWRRYWDLHNYSASYSDQYPRKVGVVSINGETYLPLFYNTYEEPNSYCEVLLKNTSDNSQITLVRDMHAGDVWRNIVIRKLSCDVAWSNDRLMFIVKGLSNDSSPFAYLHYFDTSGSITPKDIVLQASYISSFDNNDFINVVDSYFYENTQNLTDFNFDLESDSNCFYLCTDTKVVGDPQQFNTIDFFDINKYILQTSSVTDNNYCFGGSDIAYLPRVPANTTYNYGNSVLVGDDIYVSSGALSSPVFLKYSMSSDEWSLSGGSIFDGSVDFDRYYTNRVSDIMCSDGNSIYKFVGKNFTYFYKCDLNNSTVSGLAYCPVMLSEDPSITYCSDNNSIYVIHDKDDVNIFWRYDISTDSWDYTSEAPITIRKGMLCCIDSDVYAIEGGIGNNRFVKYDTLTESWTLLSNRPPEDTDNVNNYLIIGITSNSNDIFCVLWDNVNKKLLVYRYDVESDYWSLFISRSIYFVNDATGAAITTFFDYYFKDPDYNLSNYISCICNNDYLFLVVNGKISIDGVFYRYSDGSNSGIYRIPLVTDIDTQSSGNMWSQPSSTGQFPNNWSYPESVPYFIGDNLSNVFQNKSVDVALRNSNRSAEKIWMLAPALKSYVMSKSGITSGKYYFEFRLDGPSYETWLSKNGRDLPEFEEEWIENIDNFGCMFGVCPGDIDTDLFPYSSCNMFYSSIGMIRQTTKIMHNNLPTLNDGDVVGVAIDKTGGKIWFSVNGIWVPGKDDYSTGGDPATGTNPAVEFSCAMQMFPVVVFNEDFASTVTAMFDSRHLVYTPPAGFAPFGYAEMSDEAPVGWSAPTSMVLVPLAPQPGSWQEPPTSIPYFDEAPEEWTQPTGNSADFEPQPFSWVASSHSESRHVVPADLQPILHEPAIVQVPYRYNIGLVNLVGNAQLNASDELSTWNVGVGMTDPWLNIRNSIVFQITEGECYFCRLTAWDDATHSSLNNNMFLHDRVRVSALAYNITGANDTTYTNGIFEFIKGPVYNHKLKGNIYYYGDFSMSYRYQSNVFGDYLIFRPRLEDIDDTVPYGVHDFVITLHYSYT